LALAALPGTAAAAGGGVLADPPRAAALAGAVTGRAGEVGGLALNPAGLADVEAASVQLSSHAGWLDLWFARRGEDRQGMARLVAGYGLSVAAPLPGPEWLRPLSLGADLYVPAQHVLRIRAPVRSDEPFFPLYEDRVEHIAGTFGMAVDLGALASAGAAVTVTPDLYAPTTARYDPSRGETPDDNVVLRIRRELRMRTSALAGVRVQVLDGLSLGAAWRQAVACSAFGDNDTMAGPLSTSDPVDFLEFWTPEELALGAALQLGERWLLSADAVWARWSEYRTIHNRPAQPAWSDVLLLRGGAQWSPVTGLFLRGGYAWEPSPVPEQDGQTNLLDGSRHVGALGAGLDLEALGGPALVVDLYVRAHLLSNQTASKRAEALPDADGETPQREIDNLGFPGFESGGSLWQAGVSLTFSRRSEAP